MKRPPPEERRRQIMEAALPLFAERGFQGTTNRDIAEAAGVAPGLIYWYFDSKEGLLNAILDEFIPFDQMAMSPEFMKTLPPSQLLPQFAHAAAMLFNNSRIFDIVRIVASESLRNPETGKRFNEIIKRGIGPIIDYMREQISVGRLRAEDPLIMAQMLFSSIALLFLRRRIGLDETLLTYDIDTTLQSIVDAFLRAYAPN
jgi:AcrR family transcriptional regulator